MRFRDIIREWFSQEDVPTHEFEKHVLWTSPDGFRILIMHPSDILPNSFFLVTPKLKIVASFTIQDWNLDDRTFWMMDKVHTQLTYRGQYYMLNLLHIVYRYLKGKVGEVYVNGKNEHVNLYKKVGFRPAKMNDVLDRLIRHHTLHMLYPNPNRVRQDYTLMVNNLGGKI